MRAVFAQRSFSHLLFPQVIVMSSSRFGMFLARRHVRSAFSDHPDVRSALSDHHRGRKRAISHWRSCRPAIGRSCGPFFAVVPRGLTFRPCLRLRLHICSLPPPPLFSRLVPSSSGLPPFVSHPPTPAPAPAFALAPLPPALALAPSSPVSRYPRFASSRSLPPVSLLEAASHCRPPRASRAFRVNTRLSPLPPSGIFDPFLRTDVSRETFASFLLTLCIAVYMMCI